MESQIFRDQIFDKLNIITTEDCIPTGGDIPDSLGFRNLILKHLYSKIW